MKVGDKEVKDILIGDTQVLKVYKGEDVIWEKSVSPLPSGYRQVEYLESTGTQYIDTGYYPTNNTLLQMKYRYVGSSIEYYWAFGSRDTTSQNGFGVIFNYYKAGGDNYYEIISVYNNYTYPSNTYSKDYREQDIIIEQSSLGLVINGIKEKTNPIGTFACSYPCLLFWGSTAGVGDNARKPKNRIYTCKIYENDILQRDFIPCLDPNNRPCMFDLVTQQPFYNRGTGEFLYGNIV